MIRRFVRVLVVSALLGVLTTAALVAAAMLAIAAVLAVDPKVLIGIAVGVVWMIATGIYVVTLEGRREGNS